MDIPMEEPPNKTSDLMSLIKRIPEPLDPMSVNPIDLVKVEALVKEEESYGNEIKVAEKKKVAVPKEKVTHSCSYCLKAFATKQNLRIHVNAVHLKLKYQCDICKKEIAKKDGLIDHMKFRHTLGEFRSQCDLCHRLVRNVNHHKKTFHASSKELVACSICSRLYKTKFSLNAHIIQAHVGVKKVTSVNCPDCSEKFSCKTSLKRHVERVHLQIRYRCHFCSYENSDKSMLLKHIKLHHMEEEVRKMCDDCGQFFQKIKDHKNHCVAIPLDKRKKRKRKSKKSSGLV